jgi:flagellar assembly protein FliH
VDELIAVEWDPTELHSAHPFDEAAPRSAAEPEEQDALIEAIAAANAAREQSMRQELESRVAAAYREGFDAGRVEGEAVEAARLRSAVQAADDVLAELRAGEQRWAGGIEENICALAVAVARHVIGRELREDGAAVADLVRRAVAEFPVDQPLRIRVSPQDHAMICAACGDSAAAGMLGDRDARWVADAQIGRGGCVVEGRERIVDGRVDTALERLYRRLTYTHA